MKSTTRNTTLHGGEKAWKLNKLPLEHEQRTRRCHKHSSLGFRRVLPIPIEAQFLKACFVEYFCWSFSSTELRHIGITAWISNRHNKSLFIEKICNAAVIWRLLHYEWNSAEWESHEMVRAQSLLTETAKTTVKKTPQVSVSCKCVRVKRFHVWRETRNL